MTQQKRKVKLSLRSIRILSRIDEYIRQYNVRGDNLPGAASDELDGAVFRFEVDELIRKRLLAVIRDRRGYGDDPGESYTLYLTPRAIRMFWPERKP